ncbi:helix-turn-helix domain-containing protein [Proteiniphilum acetatigenes]|uniref:helix-turn-helix domain-containing protein n=1 Tax=Proteiniphilum acetatigenes TaxID=294710 RepID=UPI0003680FA0|nr:helix-turn-helix transcriptional regulator [Proteiniphilum acetatigenes]
MVDLSKIEVLAREKGIQLGVLAERAGISYQALNKLIRNNSTKIETLVSIAETLDVSPSIFFDNISNETSQIINYLKERDDKIEELIRENERLKVQIEQGEKSVAPGEDAACADVS